MVAIGVAAVVLALGLLVQQHFAGRASAVGLTGGAPQNPVILRDAQDRTRMSVQLQPNRLDTGTFDFSVIGVGDYTGQVAIPQPAIGGTQAAAWAMSGTVQANFVTAGSQTPSSAAIQLTGSVATSNYAATVTLADSSRAATYVLVTDQGDPATGAALIVKVGQAMASKDYATLYAATSPETLKGMTEQQFAQSLQSQTTPQIVAMTPTGTSQDAVSSGYSYLIEPTSVTYVKSDGSQATISVNVYLVREHGNWYVVTSDTPPSP
jgi:hypothetical protein